MTSVLMEYVKGHLITVFIVNNMMEVAVPLNQDTALYRLEARENVMLSKRNDQTILVR